jgi:hypothetical protein
LFISATGVPGGLGGADDLQGCPELGRHDGWVHSPPKITRYRHYAPRRTSSSSSCSRNATSSRQKRAFSAQRRCTIMHAGRAARWFQPGLPDNRRSGDLLLPTRLPAFPCGRQMGTDQRTDWPDSSVACVEGTAQGVGMSVIESQPRLVSCCTRLTGRRDDVLGDRVVCEDLCWQHYP